MPRQFDAIAIGSGLGGLIAGALYARAGHRVLVLERNANFGGAATVYRHGSLSIEASLHEVDGLDAEDPKMPILRALGLDHDIPFVNIGDLHEVRSPLLGEPFVLPHGYDAGLAATKRRFSQQAKGIEGYFERIRAVRHAVATISEHQDDRDWWLWNAPTLPWRLWPLVRDRGATVGEVFRRLFGDHEAVKFALASNLAYYADDPEAMPFISYAIPQASYLLGGGHYIRGGSQVLTDRLVAIIRDAGGEAEINREVDAILLNSDSVRGVRHRAVSGDDAKEESAPVVFGNAAPTVLAAMLPDTKRALFMSRYKDRRLSLSLWTISVGLSRRSQESGVKRYSTAILPAWLTAISRYREAAAIPGENPATRIPPYGFVAYDQIDSGLNQHGPFLASLVGLDRIDNWENLATEEKRTRKERWMDRIIADLDGQYPGIEGAVVHREMSTAETFHRYLNTPGGALYGFAPESRGFMPLAETAVGGLYLASAFTGGGGFTGAILGGGWAARAAAKSEVRRATSPVQLPAKGVLFAPMLDRDNFGLSELHETIRGGERVLIRRMRPEDMALYPDFLGDVSAEDLRLRFFAHIAELSAAEFDKLTHLDYRREMAFVALDEDADQMLGLVRLKDELDEQTAEFAILVRSRLKGHGLGWLLMRRAIDYAKEKGLRRIYGDVLVENTTMLQMCAELGFHAVDIGSEITRVVLDLQNIRGH